MIASVEMTRFTTAGVEENPVSRMSGTESYLPDSILAQGFYFADAKRDRAVESHLSNGAKGDI
jgi:hypothetical protein